MKVSVYADSSFIVSLACADSGSGIAGAYMIRHPQVLPLTPLHRIEVRNAIRRAAAKASISEEERRTAFRQIEDDLQDGLLVHLPISWPDVFRRADELSDKYCVENGQRTIDLLHVAVALDCGAETFITLDRRQRDLARAAGLNVKP